MTQHASFPAVPYGDLRLIGQTPVAQLFAGVDILGAPATVIVLSPGAAVDPTVRAGFERLVNDNLYGAPPTPIAVTASGLVATPPWAATVGNPPGQHTVAALLELLPPPGTAPPGPAPWMTPQPPANLAAPPPGAGGYAWAPPPPAAKRGFPVGALVASIVVVALAVLGGGVALVLTLNRHLGTPRADRPVPAVSHPLDPPPTPSDPPASAAPSADPDKPRLRDVPARAILGPSYAPGEQTYPMAFAGWPFAFRTPASWGCVKGTISALPDANAWACVDEGHSGTRQRFNIMLRTCPTTCTASEQREMNQAWFDHPTRAVHIGDNNTWIVQTPIDADGLYTVDFSRYIPAVPGGGPPHYQVGIYLESPPATKATVQKILNDVVSQTS